MHEIIRIHVIFTERYHTNPDLPLTNPLIFYGKLMEQSDFFHPNNHHQIHIVNFRDLLRVIMPALLTGGLCDQGRRLNPENRK